MNLHSSKKIQQLQDEAHNQHNTLKVCEEYLHGLPVLIKTENDRFLLAVRELAEATKPMKTNNWDSVREAFKGPVRIDLNERN